MKKNLIEFANEQNSNRICELLKNIICEYYDLSINIFDSRNRVRPIIKAKQAAIYLIRKSLPKVSLSYIAAQMKFDHANIIHHLKTVSGLIETNIETRTEIAEIEAILKFKMGESLGSANIEDEYYYVDLSNCVSFKLPNNKSIVLAGYTKKEIEAFRELNNLFFFDPVEHIKTNLFILQKKDN